MKGNCFVTSIPTSQEGYIYPTTAPAKNKEMTYRTDISGFSVISATPLEPDPYEVNLVRVGESTVAGGGEGLFAARDIPSGTVLSFYNGVRFHDCHVSRISVLSLSDQIFLILIILIILI